MIDSNLLGEVKFLTSIDDMKTLTLRIPEEHLCNELDKIQEILDVKSDTKAIKILIREFRKKEAELIEVIGENNNLRNSLEAEQSLRKSFTKALKCYIE